MLISEFTLDYGRLIHKVRTKKGISLEELAHSLCSVQYLKKLEKGKEKGRRDIIDPLLKRLEISYSNMEETLKNIIINLTSWHNAMIFKNLDYVEKYKKKAKEIPDDLEISEELKLLINLMEFRYSLFMEHLNIAASQLALLKKSENKMHNSLKNYFNYFQGIYYLLKNEYLKALDILHEAERGFIDTEGKCDQGLMYHLALTHSQNMNIPLAKYYAKQANGYFQVHKIFARSIECQIIIGINEVREKLYEKAYFTFKKVIASCNNYNLKESLPIAIHNLAFIESQRGNRESAIQLFQESIELKSESDNSYLISLIYLAEEYILCNELNKAKETLKKVLDAREKYNLSIEHYYSAIILQKELEQSWEELLYILEHEAIPYFEEKGQRLNLQKYYYKAAEIYENERKYKLSSEYFKKLANILLGGLSYEKN